MYEWGACDFECRFIQQKKGTANCRASVNFQCEELFLLLGFLFDRFHAAVMLRLRFGVFHGLLGFGGLLGAGLGALLALLVENFFAAEQFEERLVGAVAFVPVGTDDARVSAFAIAKPR